MAAATPGKVAPRDRLQATTLWSYLLSLTSLDFLNLGVPSPTPSLGELLRQAKGNVEAWWLSLNFCSAGADGGANQLYWRGAAAGV